MCADPSTTHLWWTTIQHFPPLRTNSSFAFAHDTISNRIPSIADKVVKTNQGIIQENLLQQVAQLGIDIAQNKCVPAPPESEDSKEWVECFESQFKDKSWHDVPWFAAEAYFYRLILHAVDYFKLGIDPFKPQKNAELNSEHVWELVKAALDVLECAAEQSPLQKFMAVLPFALWGNRSDLCYVKVASKGSSKAFKISAEQSNVLFNNSDEVAKFLGEKGLPVKQIDVICDNSGAELVLDLVLVDLILSAKIASNVVLLVKQDPTFVSDATPLDVQETIDTFASKISTDISSIGTRLQQCVRDGTLKVLPNSFWNSWKFFHAMPSNLAQSLEEATLVISKGDANYRRVLGDHLWPVDTPFSQIASFFPNSLLCLRTLKSDSIVGLTRDQADILDKEDREWRVNGQRGIIQFFRKH